MDYVGIVGVDGGLIGERLFVFRIVEICVGKICFGYSSGFGSDFLGRIEVIFRIVWLGEIFRIIVVV